MQIDQLGVPDAYVFTPRQFPDDRGVFLEWFKADVLADAVGHRLDLAQANHSVSRRGVVRGIHYADVPPGQAKYVYCPRGAVLDIVIDIRVGSPSYGAVDSVRLDDVDRRGVYLAEGLGHAFISLADDSVVTYLCSTPYNPTGEHGVNPLDADLDLPWPDGIDPLLSDKDRAAPSLAEARDQGLLPSYDGCVAFYERLRNGQ